MGSVETKVLIFAVLLLGIGFVYTTIIQKEAYTGAAVSESDEAVYDYDSYNSPYAGEEGLVTTPQPSEETGYSTYEEAPVQLQPSSYGTSDDAQKSLLLAMGIDNIDPEKECEELMGGPFEDWIAECKSTLTKAKRDVAT